MAFFLIGWSEQAKQTTAAEYETAMLRNYNVLIIRYFLKDVNSAKYRTGKNPGFALF